MNQDIKRQWVEALRSGQYEHNGTGYLKDNSGYSALGVLVALYIQTVPNTAWVYETWDESYVLQGREGFVEDDDACILPSEVAKWAGIEEDPAFRTQQQVRRDEPGTFISDTDELSFNKIADLIEFGVQ